MKAWSVSDADIIAARPARHRVDPSRPYAFLVEPECNAAGQVEDVATVFLTNKECPFKCLMCDLWRDTTEDSVPVGAIPSQIDYALSRLPAAPHLKLYNSGNFFDRQAIPPADYAAIAQRLVPFKTVIVENHPRLCTEACVEFRGLLQGRLEVALGLETAHPAVLKRLNKRMTVADFERAVAFLRKHDIDVRTFILLRPPFLSDAEGVEWALRSVSLAFEAGVQCCSIIPTRPGNGIMDRLARTGHFARPSMTSIETVLAEALDMGRGRVFMDLWDLEQFYDCDRCGPLRQARLRQMNLTQRVLPEVACTCA